jgi:hypothetical protein
MIALLRAVLGHVQALFATGTALKLGSETPSPHSERRALLRRRARRYEREGLHGIAAHLRRRAQALDR